MSDVTERTSEPPRLRVRQRWRELRTHREVLWNLVRKEVKVKYTASVLGAVWSLLNPVVFLAVFWFVAKVLRGGVPDYPVFLLAGLLPWNLFSLSLSNGSQSVIANANLVKKVYFPREILPLATVGVALVDFVLQSAVFLGFILVFYGFDLGQLWLYPLAFVSLLLVTVAFTLLISALNVRYRDVQHLIGLALLVWFWMTPIVYAAGTVYTTLSESAYGGVIWRLYLLNPMSWVVMGFQEALYHTPTPTPVFPPFPTSTFALGLVAVSSFGAAAVYLAWRLYFSMSGDFAEEL
jgi:ABC-2 type transport system permease protein